MSPNTPPVAVFDAKPYDVAVVGGGAAGLFCASVAARRGRRVVLIEHNDRVGKKIEISGGGRCNFTNLNASADRYLSAHPDFCKSSLARFTPADFVGLVDAHRIHYHEKKLGQLFCDGSARAIIDMLLEECCGVEIRCGCRVGEVSKDTRFRLQTTTGGIDAESLVIATGGLSFPKLGATGWGHRMAMQFGLRVTPLRPGLVPLRGGEIDFSELAGVSLPVRVVAGRIRFDEAMLFTHRGVSGPVILQASSYWHLGQPLRVDLSPEGDARELLEAGRNKTPSACLSTIWPQRFADTWCRIHGLEEKPLRHFKEKELSRIARGIHDWQWIPSGTEGYPKAEVTVGGVDVRDLSSKTMESRTVRGLFFIGEVVDVTGWLGGYNFQWAWASAMAAGGAV